MFNRYSFLFVFFLLLTGCTAAQPQPGAITPTRAALGQAPTAAPTSSLTPFPAATTAVPASATPAPTATPTLHPMSIAALRAGSYPGSEIVIEQELDPGVNYHRYYASYQSEGLKIYALLTVPNGEPPEGGWPAIVFNHGYIAPSVYRTTERYVAYVDWLARSGYIVFRIDYRGHDRSEGAASGAYGSPGYTIDVLNALASIRQYPQANPERVGMWGHSMGGYLTLRAMVVSADIRAGVIWSGVVGSYPDMVNNWRRSGPTPTPPPYARRWRYDWVREFGSPEQNPDFWASVSANSYVADLSGPLQLHHSPEDEEVPVEFSESLAQQIQDVGGDVEIYLYPGDNHNLSNNFSTAMNRTIAFFNQYLKP
jgi:dipeptidyl aminopeptidase/acylaminoacyl peptidase